MPVKPRESARPPVQLFGGGGADAPGDRETRFVPFDPTREEKNRYGQV